MTINAIANRGSHGIGTILCQATNELFMNMTSELKHAELYPDMFVSIDGSKIYNARLQKYYTPYINNCGYLCACGIPVHRLVASAFKFDSYFAGAEVDHIDCNKLNNHVDNLEWVTAKENQRRTYMHGRRGAWLGKGYAMPLEGRIKQGNAIKGAKNPAAKTRTIVADDGRIAICHTRMELRDAIAKMFGRTYSMSYIKCLINCKRDDKLKFNIVEGQSTIKMHDSSHEQSRTELRQAQLEVPAY